MDDELIHGPSGNKSEGAREELVTEITSEKKSLVEIDLNSSIVNLPFEIKE